MQVSLLSLDELIPHRHPMRLIDTVVKFDFERGELIARFKPKEAWLGNWCAIEYMAQAAATLAGASAMARGEDSGNRPGVLLGTRRLELKFDEFDLNVEYDVSATFEIVNGDSASFSCKIYRADDCEGVLASAILNAYRPADMKQFLTEIQR